MGARERMSVLKLKQVTASGKTKIFKLDSKSRLKTFGSSRKANLLSIDSEAAKFDGVFEHRADGWHFISFDLSSNNSDLKLTSGSTFEFKNSIMHVDIKEIKDHLYNDFNTLPALKGTIEKQIYIVSLNNRILDTKILNKNQGFQFAIHGKKNTFKILATTNWISEDHSGFEIKSKLVHLDEVAHLSKTQNQALSQNEKRTVIATLSVFAFLIFMAVVTPKPDRQIVEAVSPKVAMNVIVKMEKKREIKKPMQKTNQASQASAQPTKEVSGSAGGGKVSALLKGSIGIRISQLIGKVSATEARTANVLVTTKGIKAGEAASGRALAAVGKTESSGRNWNGESAGTGGGISTVGVGGGNGTKGLAGGLGQGKTGSGGVGLIEEESEVIGGLDREIIAQYIKTQLGQILYCYERQLSANPDLYGKVAVKFTISGTGQVETQTINDTTLKSAPVEGCILSKVAKWKFPEPRGGTKVLVTYPFLFKSTN